MVLAAASQYGQFFNNLITQLERKNDNQANINLIVLEENLNRLLSTTSSRRTLQSTTRVARWAINAEVVKDARAAITKTRGAVGLRNLAMALANAKQAYAVWQAASQKFRTPG